MARSKVRGSIENQERLSVMQNETETSEQVRGAVMLTAVVIINPTFVFFKCYDMEFSPPLI